MTRRLRFTQFRIIQESAENTIAVYRNKFGFPLSPPIPVDLLAQSMFGLQLRIQKISERNPQIVAALSVTDRIIFGVDNRSWNSYRFSVAHEIGHWVLHGGDNCEELISLTDQTSNVKKFLRSSGKKGQDTISIIHESEANWFAHMLLIPVSMLLLEAKEFEIIDLQAIRKLAAKFRVSNQVMYYRIKELYDYLYWKGPIINWESITAAFLQNSSQIMPTRVKGMNYTNRQKTAFKQSKEFVQPKIVEFCGTSKSGKDTEINIVADVLQDMYGYKVRIVDEGIKDCIIDKDLDIERFFKTLSIAVEKLYEARYENPGNCDFILFNRCLFDRLSFLPALRNLGRITKEQVEIHTKYSLSYTHLEDIVLLLQISPEESMRREHESRRKYVEHIADIEGKSLRHQSMLNYETISALNDSYSQTYENYQDQFGHVCLFMGDEIDIFQRSVELVNAILPPAYRQLPMPNLIDEFFGLSKGERIQKFPEDD